jgi:hypothetical protein
VAEGWKPEDGTSGMEKGGLWKEVEKKTGWQVAGLYEGGCRWLDGIFGGMASIWFAGFVVLLETARVCWEFG